MSGRVERIAAEQHAVTRELIARLETQGNQTVALTLLVTLDLALTIYLCIGA